MVWQVNRASATYRQRLDNRLALGALPGEPHLIGIRVLDGELKSLEILGHLGRFAHSKDGLHLAIEFVKTKETQLRLLWSFV